MSIYQSVSEYDEVVESKVIPGLETQLREMPPPTSPSTPRSHLTTMKTAGCICCSATTERDCYGSESFSCHCNYKGNLRRAGGAYCHPPARGGTPRRGPRLEADSQSLLRARGSPVTRSSYPSLHSKLRTMRNQEKLQHFGCNFYAGYASIILGNIVHH